MFTINVCSFLASLIIFAKYMIFPKKRAGICKKLRLGQVSLARNATEVGGNFLVCLDIETTQLGFGDRCFHCACSLCVRALASLANA